MSADEIARLRRREAELEAEVARLRAEVAGAAGRAPADAGAPMPAGRDELFSAIEKARMPMILTDPNRPDDPIVFANRAFQELSGYAAAELVGRNCRFLQGPDTNPAQIAEIRDAIAARRDVAVEILNYRRDGTPFFNELFISPVFDRDGTLLYHFGSQLDVTGWRRSRRLLEASEARLRAILDSAVEFAVMVTDRDGRVTDWNVGAERVFGWPAGEMVGDMVERIFTPEDRAIGRAATEMALSLSEGRASDERWHLRRDGSRLFAAGEMMPLRGADEAHLGFIKIVRDRTAEHLAGRALRDSEARLRRAQEAGGVGLFTTDVADDLVAPTPEFCRLYGLPVRDSYPARAFESLVLPDDAGLMSSAESRRSGDVLRDVQYRIRRADTGALRWIARTGEIERDDAGRPLRFSGAARDVTERREADAALARSEGLYRALFEAIDDGFCIIEFFDGPHGPLSDYVHVEANPGYQRHTGIADIVGRTLREIAPTQADEWVELYGEVLRTGRPVRFEREFVAVARHIEVSAARVEPASRRQVSVLFRDVTERKRAEAALRTSEALVREHAERVQLALGAGAIVGTWVWDLPTDRFTVDEAFARTFGLDPTLGRDGLSLEQVVQTVHPEDAAGLAAAIDAAVARGGAYAHQYRVRRADGVYRWIEANGRVDHGPDGTPLRFPGVLIDVEERRAVEAERDRAAAALRALNETLEQRVAERSAELMRAEELLRQSQKMEAVGQLTGGIAHDFNNLLTGISGSLDLLQKRVAQGRLNDLDRYLVAAGGAAKRAAALTHRLLAFSRRQTLDPRPTDVTRLIHGMADLIRRTVGPAITVETVDMAGLWTALVDPHQLENALLNLAINARDAMPNGGRLTIETGNKWMDDRAARERDLPPGQYLSVCVSDTGTGMAPDIVARAFEPFFTTKPLGQGTGLGLSMIYGFARQSGGQVRIYSEPGEGTMVCIYLPRHYGEGEGRPAAEGRDGGAPRAAAGETVLVVDDEPTVRMLVADVLSDLGYGAVEAEDGPSGLKVLATAGRIDLLITDVGLPGGMNGRQVADAARVLRPDLKVLFITGYAENAAVGNGHLEPGMAVLTKPFAMDELGAKIRSLIEG
ncbi:PAS domain S-box protein [Lichenibacterium dinghuense]|uniref:PAS domain S-box protein n=1 Tax=Lichenibacterium dinghuense TaxID=2895977 RepID=UPI0028157136|nr:PAS domain S-box protein [Lichenibacterium sp. 6Y81]